MIVRANLRAIGPRRVAFTLVEVILAILIISGIMVVLLYFYQRTAEVRRIAMEEAEFTSTSRMFFEQLTAELRAARPGTDGRAGVEGSSNSISIITAALPPFTRWIVSTNEPVALAPSTDLKSVFYAVALGTNRFVARGVERIERLVGAAAIQSFETNIDLAMTNAEPLLSEPPAADQMSEPRPLPRGPLLTDQIRYLRFRYWSGTEWLDAWSGYDLPSGVEITAGRDPLPADAEPNRYPYEVFRRVVHLPNSEPPLNRVGATPELEPELP